MSDADIDIQLRAYAARWRASVDDLADRQPLWQPPPKGVHRSGLVTTAVVLIAVITTVGVLTLYRGPSTDVRTGPGPATSASLPPGAVPWVDRPAPPAAATTTSTTTAGGPSCASSHLAVTPLGHGPAAGSTHWRFSVVNTGSSPCTLSRFGATVTGIGADGRQVVLADGQRDPSQQLLTLPPGRDAELRLSSANFCDESARVLPSVRFATVVVHLPEGDLRLDNLDLAVCEGGHVSVEVDPTSAVPDPVPAPGSLASLEARLALPRSVRSGSRLFFTVTLTNPTDVDVVLDPCPAYEQSVHTERLAITKSYYLNCGAVRVVRAHSQVLFAMQLDVPSDVLPTEAAKFDWRFTTSTQPIAGGVIAVQRQES